MGHEKNEYNKLLGDFNNQFSGINIYKLTFYNQTLENKFAKKKAKKLSIFYQIFYLYLIL